MIEKEVVELYIKLEADEANACHQELVMHVQKLKGWVAGVILGPFW